MVAGLFFVICEVLLISGVAKVLSPSPTRLALSTIGLPSSDSLVRCLGLLEVVLGVAGILLGGRYLPIAIGGLFAFFTLFILFAMQHDPLISCGCFGAINEPPTLLHAFANIVFMSLALLAIGVDGMGDVINGQWAHGVPFIICVLLGALVIYLCLVYLPRFWRRFSNGSSR